MGDPIVLFFLLGLFARLVRSDLRLPDGLYDILAFYLLLAIGLKGGVELSRQPMVEVMPQVLGCIGMGLVIPFVLVPVLRALRFNRADSASLAGHYGSVSVVTFAVSLAYVQKQGVPVELVRYPRSNHDLSRTGEPWLLVDRLGRLRQWFGYWLQGKGAN